VKEALPASAATKATEIWFQDEARVGQQGSLEYIWAPIGSRPLAVRDNRHDSVYLFGALCAHRAVGAAIIMPAANTEAMNEHLKEISTQVAPGAHAILVCDGAGWHQRGGKLRVPDNITLLSLPPYSPELNSIVARHDGWPASDTRMAGRCASLRWPGVCEATRDFCRGSEGWNVRKVRHRPDRLPRRPIARTRGFVHNASALHTTPPAHQQQPRWIFIYSVR
jgi:hypothetical protein